MRRRDCRRETLSYSRRTIAIESDCRSICRPRNEPAANLDIEEAGLWLRFFVARSYPKEKPAGMEPAGETGGSCLFVKSGSENRFRLDQFVAECFGDRPVGDLALVDIEAVAQMMVVDQRLQALVGKLQAVVKRRVVERMG
ncbi:hypothetical protein C8D77_12361 [Mesorhizobium loti]|uniref:Uncharacterized protein n=1 Tax=Rhizobium loti TaxID=381 RepID=A0A8E2W7U4_RHILI|nr:hypothetical protein C8D77_12361 [Mesorhizobium loti]